MEPNIYSPKVIKEILSDHTAAPLKSLGQNFLISENIVDRMICESGVGSESGAIEIGPGIGALTSKLCAAAKKTVAVEIDRKMVEILKTTAPSVTVIEGDALKIDISELIATELSNCSEIFVFGNLPYYITSPLVMKILESAAGVNSITVMVQREAAERFCAPEGTRESGAITLAVRYLSEPRILFNVPRGCFYPSPNVDSSVISFVPRPYASQPRSEEKMFAVIKAAFSQRRKTAVNALMGSVQADKQRLNDIFAECGIPASARAEQLKIDDYIRISDML